MAGVIHRSPRPKSVPGHAWRPTGNLSRRMSRIIFRVTLTSVAIVLLLLAVQAAMGHRQALYDRVGAAIDQHTNAAIVALDFRLPSDAERVTEQVAAAARATRVTLTDLEGEVLSRRVTPPGSVAESAGGLERVLSRYLPEMPLPEITVSRRIDINGDPLGWIEVAASTRPILVGTWNHLKVGMLGLLLVVVLAAVTVAACARRSPTRSGTCWRPWTRSRIRRTTRCARGPMVRTR